MLRKDFWNLLGGSRKASSCMSVSSGISLQRKNCRNSWSVERDMKISLAFSGHLHRFERQGLVPGWPAGGGFVGAWLFGLDFSSFCCFYCLNSPEPLGRRLIGESQNDSSCSFSRAYGLMKNVSVTERGWLKSVRKLMAFCEERHLWGVVFFLLHALLLQVQAVYWVMAGFLCSVQPNFHLLKPLSFTCLGKLVGICKLLLVFFLLLVI